MATDPAIRPHPAAARAYRDGVAALVAATPEAAAVSFDAAIAADVRCALAHAGLAVARYDLGDGDRAADAVAAAARLTAHSPRWERHHVAIVDLVLQGRLSRASALGREHLQEFPTDAVVRHVLTHRCDDVDDL